MKNLRSLTLGLLVIVLISASFVLRKSNSKIAYVRSQVLIYSYDGTKEAQVEFAKQRSEWEANIDTLKADFEREILAFDVEKNQMSEAKVIEKRKMLMSKDQQLQQYTLAIEGRIEQQDNEIMQGVLNQINSFTEEYALANGYDIILGTNESGNVLYGKQTLDITEQLLEALNKKYHGK